ncbi:mavicyanin-like [Pistacia vera]|uniref:mavicyanin-like n=1 Tax=Pistacia vera TaxID=55513 RepID=UPI001262F721|nr:mavicyanin-like [Pistacia vera]
MELTNINSMGLVMMILALYCGVAIAAEYKVGDEPGWTRKVPVDYYEWASDKNFYIGDTLFFQYNTPTHDVMKVTAKNLKQCNTRNPIAVYRTGADKIELRRAGHYFFICSTPGHCQAGQKLSVVVDYKPGQNYEEEPKNPSADPRDENSPTAAPDAGETPETDPNQKNPPMAAPDAPGPSSILLPYYNAPKSAPTPKKKKD